MNKKDCGCGLGANCDEVLIDDWVDENLKKLNSKKKVQHPGELNFEETCKLELKLKEQEAIIKALREEVLYWRLLLKEMCDNMDEALINEYKK
jgi:hypothetical protein